MKLKPEAPGPPNLVVNPKLFHYGRLNLILKYIVRDARIKKKVTPHILRHTRATHLTSKLTESEMCHYLGWQLGSDMARVYVHLSGRDIDNAIYSKVYGIKIEGSSKDDAIKPVLCLRCKESCGPSSEYCYGCGVPLSEEKIFDMEQKSIEIRKEFLILQKMELMG